MRRFRWAVVVGAICLGGLPAAQGQAPSLTLHKVNDNLYYVEGGGGNSTIIIGADGVIVVDAKTTIPAAEGVVDEVSKLTNRPITTVILTHSDADHVYGLPAFPKGITIVAHENDKEEIDAAKSAGEKRVPPPEYMPNKIVTQERENDTFDGVRITLIHIAPAHTSGDLAVYLPDQKLVIAGDLLGNGDPGIHLPKHGSSEGWIKFVTALLQLDAETYVRGHADPASKAQVEASLKNAQIKRSRIAALVKEGKSLDEVKQALNVQKPANPPPFPTFVETTYEELAKK